MMEYAPLGAYINGTYDYCAGLELEEMKEPPIPFWMMQVCWVIVAVTVIFVVVNHALWYRNRHRAHIALARNFLSHGMEVGLILTCAAATREGFLEPDGEHAAQGCLTTSALYITGVVVAATSYYMRLVKLAASMRRAKLIRNQTAATADAKNQNTSPSVRSASGFEYMLVLLKSLAAIDGGSSDTNEALRDSSYTTKPMAIGLMTATVFAIAVMPIAILSGTVDAYHSECIGCEWYIEFLATYTAVLIPFFIMAGRLIFKLRNETDQYGVRRELALSLITGGVITWIGIILIAVDPGAIEHQKKFSYEWLIWLGFLVPAFIWGPYQSLFKANFLDRHTAGIASDMSAKADENVLTRSVMMRNLSNDKFLDLAQAEFVMENISFLTDVEVWRRSYPTKDADWRRRRGRMLIEKYIREGSLLEINIGGAERKAILAAKESEEEGFEMDIFEVAENEVVDMVMNGVWLHFVIAERKSHGNITNSSIIVPC